LESDTFAGILLNNSTSYKFGLIDSPLFDSGENTGFLKNARFKELLYTAAGESNFGFLETFYAEEDIFGLGQYIFNYFIFQTFLVFCILLVCLFGAIAVVINKSDTRYTRSGQNTLQVKSSDFTIL